MATTEAWPHLAVGKPEVTSALWRPRPRRESARCGERFLGCVLTFLGRDEETRTQASIDAEAAQKHAKQTKHAVDAAIFCICDPFVRCRPLFALIASSGKHHHAPEGSPPPPPLHGSRPYYERGLAAARADLARAKASFTEAGETASALQALATLHLIDGDVAKAVAARRKAKALDAQALPPLAVLFRDGHDCGGLGDVYWSGAFLLKKLDETNVSDEVAFEGHLQLSTVLEDSGALVEASEHVRRASLIKPDDARLRFRSALLVPAVSSSQEAVNTTRSELERRVALLPETLVLDCLSMPWNFYIVYLGFDDASLMTSIQRAYQRAHPPLTKQLVATTKKERLRIGFAGAYWKRHSVCKLLCGIVRGLAALPDFEVVLFDATEESDDWLAWTLWGRALCIDQWT